MNKILVVVFDDEATAYKGLNALRDIHNGGDITLFASAIIKKKSSGGIDIKQQDEKGPIGTVVGMLTGSIIGLLGGPAGVAAGASLGGMTGILFDLWHAGVDIDFVDEISTALTPSKTAVIADVDETWVIPVDTKMKDLGGRVYRRLRSEVAEDQLVRENAVFKAELKQLETELEQAAAEDKAAIQKHIDTIKKKIKSIQDQAEARVKKLKTDAEAKIASLKEQIQRVKESQKAKIEKRIANVKTDFNTRSAKLKQANILIKEAFLS